MPDKPPAGRPFRPRTGRGGPPAARRASDVRPTGPERTERPDIPPDVEIDLPRGLRRAIEAQVRNDSVARDVQRAVTLAGMLIDEGLGEEAVGMLAWAKSLAPRSADIREALGVAHYQAGEYRDALNELRTYRRMAAAHDQDHLVADCMRALGHPVTEIAAEVQQMVASDGVPGDRQLEGLLVWAGALRDAGDVPGARAVLRRVDPSLLRRVDDEARHRLAWVEAELAAAAGELDTARRGFRDLAALPDDPFDARARLAELDDAPA